MWTLIYNKGGGNREESIYIHKIVRAPCHPWRTKWKFLGVCSFFHVFISCVVMYILRQLHEGSRRSRCLVCLAKMSQQVWNWISFNSYLSRWDRDKSINFKGSTCQILQCTPLNLALTCLPGLDGLWRLLGYLFSRNSDPRWWSNTFMHP